MDCARTPFAIQELVDLCIDFVCYLPADLAACALVSRSWVHTAQRRLFAEVRIQPELGWSRLQDALHRSPHLIRHIHHLELIATLPSICGFPFTHISSIVIRFEALLDEEKALALQQLFSLPTLRRITFQCNSAVRTVWLKVWERVSPTIKHLHIGCWEGNRGPSDALSTLPATPINLDSLRIDHLDGFAGWIGNHFGGLKVLSLGIVVRVAWSEFVSAAPNLEALDIVITSSSPQFDLTSLSRLSLLRLSVITATNEALVTLDGLLESIPHNGLRIVLYRPYPGVYDRLDYKISNLPTGHVSAVELEMPAQLYKHESREFPRLRLNNMLRQTDPVTEWDRMDINHYY
ncbi:hypothetical protein B0H16DRAFT_1499736 [Mycena metata]|uniref:F-box domain-containing protein n=1 Tax=Mycena metata TaxID=1033252 RepID=A0AAD7NY27_9AGAR|nr:hypothetical protein B0H16DRAFT_1499736 [Mycena metata]